MTFEIPTTSGAYRWYYLDVTSGPTTAVCIFMIGSVFSGRYAKGLRSGALPTSHAAVNFALYEHGRQTAWALTEYDQVALADEAQTLTIGGSSMAWSEGRLDVRIDEHTTPFMFTRWGRQIRARISLTPTGPSHDEVTLVPGLSHRWKPFAARAHATLTIDDREALNGAGYHDGNWGDVPLGSDLRGWEWKRVHRDDATEIHYQPWASAPARRVVIQDSTASSTDVEPLVDHHRRTNWGLDVPRGHSLLESSPFYARLESHTDREHVLGEVADFARFHRPSVRWMAGFKTRLGRTA